MTKGGVRLLGGSFRGRRLPVPPRGVRPTEARVREALFSIWYERVEGCRFLDLFAGSGAVGLEAWSRGAEHVTLIEGDPKIASGLRARLGEIAGADLEAKRSVTVRRGRLPACLKQPPTQPFDLVFADPPYGFTAYGALTEHALRWLAPDGLLALEHAVRDTPEETVTGGQRVDQRRYGEVAISFYRRTRA